MQPMDAPSTTSAKPHRADLDRAKGLAIILVVFGHLVAREGPVGVSWYEPLRQTIYLFHMPFFLYLSGVVAGLSGASRASPVSWPALACRRAARLLVPFLVFGCLILVGKMTLAPIVRIDNVPTDVWSGLRALVWDTGRSPATSVWYLLALFVFSLAAPVIIWCAGAGSLLAMAGVLYVLPAPPILYLDRVCGFFIFFVAGVLVARKMTVWDAAMDRWRRPALATFVALLPIASGLPAKVGLLAAGLLAMPALHGLVRHWHSPVLLWLGQRAFSIYLLNTICIGLAKAILLFAVSWHGAHFLPFAGILMVAGLLGPISLAALVQFIAAQPIAARACGWSRSPRGSVGSR